MLCPLFFLAPVQVADGIDVGDLIVKAMGEVGLCHSEMWRDQGYPDPSQWSKALRGQAPLDLHRLRHLVKNRQQMQFWAVFLSKLASALIARSFAQMFETYAMAKADLRKQETQTTERKSA